MNCSVCNSESVESDNGIVVYCHDCGTETTYETEGWTAAEVIEVFGEPKIYPPNELQSKAVLPGESFDDWKARNND